MPLAAPQCSHHTQLLRPQGLCTCCTSYWVTPLPSGHTLCLLLVFHPRRGGILVLVPCLPSVPDTAGAQHTCGRSCCATRTLRRGGHSAGLWGCGLTGSETHDWEPLNCAGVTRHQAWEQGKPGRCPLPSREQLHPLDTLSSTSHPPAAPRAECNQQACPPAHLPPRPPASLPASLPACLGSPTGPATPWPALLTLRPPRERLPWPLETLPALSSSYLCLTLQLWGALLAAINQVWTRAALSGQQITVATVLTLMT